MSIRVRPEKSYRALLEEASKFYMARGDVYTTLRKLTERLKQEKIPYALVGGMALAAYGFVRMTQDVDILMTMDGLAAFREQCVGRGYLPAFEGSQRSFRDTETKVAIEVITSGEYPGDGKAKPVKFPDPRQTFVERDGIRVITFEKLIELKLASGISAPHRLRDLADVQDLITTLKLPIEFSAQLDPSVREKYEELWHSTQNTDDGKP